MKEISHFKPLFLQTSHINSEIFSQLFMSSWCLLITQRRFNILILLLIRVTLLYIRWYKIKFNVFIVIFKPPFHHLWLLFVSSYKWLMLRKVPTLQIFSHCSNRQYSTELMINQFLYRFMCPQGRGKFYLLRALISDKFLLINQMTNFNMTTTKFHYGRFLDHFSLYC